MDIEKLTPVQGNTPHSQRARRNELRVLGYGPSCHVILSQLQIADGSLKDNSTSRQRALKVPPVSHIEPHAVLPHWNQEYGGTFSGLEPYHFFTVVGKFPVTLMVALASGPSPEQADHSSGREW